MPLPAVPAWITDYATAHEIFCGNDNELKQAVTQMCAAGTMKYCAAERKSFRAQPEVNQIFCVTHNCKCDLCEEIASAASEIPDVLNGKRHHPSDDSSRIIAACAIYHNFGIVSAKSGIFLTAVDLGIHHNVPSLSLLQFKAAL